MPASPPANPLLRSVRSLAAAAFIAGVLLLAAGGAPASAVRPSAGPEQTFAEAKSNCYQVTAAIASYLNPTPPPSVFRERNVAVTFPQGASAVLAGDCAGTATTLVDDGYRRAQYQDRQEVRAQLQRRGLRPKRPAGTP